MTAKKYLLVFVTLLLFTHCSYKDDYYHVGQVWSYRTRPGEEGSRAIVVAVDKDDEKGVIVSLYVDRLKLQSKDHEFDILKHVPITKSALDKSITGLVDNIEELPNNESNYKEWKEIFKTNKEAIVTTPLVEYIDLLAAELMK